MKENIGKIKQVLGAVVDVAFEEKLPQILDALVKKHENKNLILDLMKSYLKFLMLSIFNMKVKISY